MATGLVAVPVASFVALVLVQPHPTPALPPVSGEESGNEPGPFEPQTWNAVTWRQVVKPFVVGPEPGHDRIDGIVETDGGLVGWGRVSAPGRNHFNDVGAVYLSRDGLAWRSVALDAGVGPDDTSEPRLVAAGPAGLIVLGGVCCEEEQAALWRSPDGLAWERLRYPEALVGALIGDLLGTDGLYVAAGSIGGRAAIWTSGDGATWLEVDPGRAELGPGTVADLVSTDDGFGAVGTADGPTWDGALWTSPDGLAWARALVDPMFTTELDTTLRHAVAAGDRMLVIGQEGPRPDRLRCLEMGLGGRVASAGSVVPAPRERTFTCAWGWESRWFQDGRGWQSIAMNFNADNPPARGELIEFRVLSAGGPGFVALGEGFEDGFPSLFASEDGNGRRKVPVLGALQPGQVALALAISGGRIVAVSENGNQPAVFIGEIR